jgi:hypothetical protein
MPIQNKMSVAVPQTLTEKDYCTAYCAVKRFAFPRQRRSIRAGICLTAAALAASTIPACLNFYRTAVPSAVITAAAVILAALIWFLQPAVDSRRAAAVFRSCPLMAQPCRVTVTRDHAVVQSKYENYTEYWTDFSVCVETPELFAAACGRQRDMLILKKQDLAPEQAAAISRCLAGAFALRYYKTGR